jgi:hypothetical protein
LEREHDGPKQGMLSREWVWAKKRELSKSPPRAQRNYL